MPPINARTREQIRVAVGGNLGPGALRLITAATNGSTTTFLSDDLWGSDNEHIGKWWLGTDDPNDGVQARVTDSAVTTNQTTLTLYPAVTSTLSADTAELWSPEFNPEDIHRYINQAIMEAVGRVYDPVEDLSLFADGRQTRFDIPTGLTMLSHIFYRQKATSISIHTAGAAWDESTDSDATVTQDTKDYKRGSGSVKIEVAGTVSNGDVLATDSFTSLDISGMTHVEFWIKAITATAAADLQLLLDDTASCTSPLETLGVPALTADTWTLVRVALANPETDTALISVGLEFNANAGANTIWVDDIRAIDNNMHVWAEMPRRYWVIDVEARDMVLTPAGRNVAGYAALRLVGGDDPPLMTADSDVSEISDLFIIARATALAYGAQSGGAATDPDDRRRMFDRWTALADREYAKLPMLTNVRRIE